MGLEPIKVWELVNRAVSHQYSVPEFQRGFVWKATQVRDLAESLWLDYPIGSMLIWVSGGPGPGGEERSARDGAAPTLWIVDGQQRTTALSILMGRKPYWWSSADDWNRILKRYDIRFDIEARDPPYFLVANAAIRKTRTPRYLSLARLLKLDLEKEEDQKTLQGLAREIKSEGLCSGMDSMEIYTRLDRVRKIRDKDLVVISIHHDLEDVVEVFSRLNSRGTRVTEADIYLGLVASKCPGWVRDEFLPFLSDLTDSGFAVDPNLLFRSLTAVGVGKSRFKDVDDAFWEPAKIQPAWSRCRAAWQHTLLRLREYGVLSDKPLSTKAALVTLVALLDRFPSEADIDPALYWLVQASRFGRYSGSGTTTLSEDLREVRDAVTFLDAVAGLLKRLPVNIPFEVEDFEREYTDGRFGRLMLYLLVYRNEAQDWDKAGARLGFEGNEILSDFQPQWHHVFPRKYLKGAYDKQQVNSLANIAVIGPNINLRIGAKAPMKYLDKYEISDEKLRQQFIDLDRTDCKRENYLAFLSRRAERLAEEANKYLASLSANIPPEVLQRQRA